MTQKEFEVETGLIIVPCAHCGITFAIPKSYDDELRKCHNTLYCPRGHLLVYYAETNEEKLTKLLSEQKRLTDRYRDKAEMSARQVRAYKGVATRLKKKA